MELLAACRRGERRGRGILDLLAATCFEPSWLLSSPSAGASVVPGSHGAPAARRNTEAAAMAPLPHGPRPCARRQICGRARHPGTVMRRPWQRAVSASGGCGGESPWR
ncbi:unnamed protein product [Urochloa humidicola]